MSFPAFKKWLTVWMIVALVAAPIICCCLAPQAQAAPEQTVPSCHVSHDSQQAAPSDSGDCDCQNQEFQADKEAAAHILTVPSAEDARWNLVWAELFPHGASIVTSEQMAYHPPPPEEMSSVPLFIQYSNLRI